MAAVIEGSSCSEVWENSIIFLIRRGIYTASVRGPVLECSNVSLVVNHPWNEPQVSIHSPMFNMALSFSSSLRNHPKIVDWYGVNQIDYIVRLLRDDPLSRRAVVSLWDPTKDTKIENAQGVISLIFQIRSTQLHLTSIFRTTDAWMCNWTLAGIPEIQRFVYDELKQFTLFRNLELGTYTQMHTSFHIYLDEVKNAENRLIFRNTSN